MVNTTLCYLKHDNKYLMLFRNKKEADLNEGKWIGIGGHVEDKETPEECMIREMKEETGLTLTSLRYRALITFVSDIYETEYMHLFTADDFEGKLVSFCNEGTLSWIDEDKLLDLPTWEGDRKFLPLIMDDKTGFFTMKLVYEKDKLIECTKAFY
ncbi:NUDIX hydrolase [Butyrivibrio sp. NC3005]|uniref:NUDIX hydrolase n=1 Tax=Butyrivibrio sp. NC3005 TaxID=1280685 RepID=UPI0003FBC0D6|nr:8-oxo-dGTP diphosphatase [Butyrivibrio sp. NC3005]